MAFFAQDTSAGAASSQAAPWRRLFRRQPRPSAWLLRERDRLPPHILARAPAFAGIEDNPVYRLFLFTRRARSSQLNWIFAYVGLFVAAQVGVAVLLSLSRLRGPWAMSLMWIGMVGFGIAMGQRGAKMGQGLFGIPGVFMEDLRLACVSPRDFAVGFWAATQRPRVMRVSAWICVILSLGAWGVIFWPFGIILPFRFIAASPLLFCAFTLVSIQFVPQSGLQGAAMAARQVRRGVEAGIRPWKVIGQILLVIVRVLLWAGAIVLALFVLSMTVGRMGAGDLPAGLRFLTRPWFWGLLATVVGAATGLVHGRHMVRSEAKYLERIEEDFAYIMRWGAMKDNRLVAFRD